MVVRVHADAAHGRRRRRRGAVITPVQTPSSTAIAPGMPGAAAAPPILPALRARAAHFAAMRVFYEEMLAAVMTAIVAMGREVI